MSLDIQSLLVIAILCGAVLTWSMAVLRHRCPDRPEVGVWIASGVAFSVGFGLIAARGAIPDLLSVVVANMLIASALCGLLIGIEIYCGARPSRGLGVGVLLLTLAAFLWFTLAAPDVSARILAISAASAVFSGRAAWLLYRHAAGHVRARSLERAVGLPFLLHAVASVLRIPVTALLDWELSAFLSAGTLQGLFLLEVIGFLVLATVSLSFLVIARETHRSEDVIWATNVGTWDWSLETGAVQINSRWAEMLGYSPAEVAPVSFETWRALLHPDDAPKIERALQAHLNGETEHYECEARLRHKNGDWLSVQIRGRVVEQAKDGRPLRMTGTHFDITDSVARRTEADAHRTLLANLTRQVPGVFYQFRRAPDGRMSVPYASEGLTDLFGVTPDTVRETADPVLSRVHPEDLPRLLQEIEESATTLTAWRSDYRVVSADGSVHWQEGFAMPERLPDESVLWHGFVAAIDERMERQQALERYAVEMEYTKQQLEEQATILVDLAEQQSATSETLAREVATKNRFFSIIAHDLRSPFTPLLGMSEILARSADALPRETVSDYAADIHTSARRLFTLVEQLLDWGRLQMATGAPAPQDLRIASLVSDLLDQAREAADAKRLTLTGRISPDLTAHVDPHILRTVVRNLIANAIKFTPSGGRIDLSACQDGDTVRISVQDDGVGIPPDMREHLFDVAVKTTTAGTDGEPGTGLGLPTCAELMRQSRGRIEPEPGPQGVGTIMRLILPATAEAWRAAEANA